jgi:hypothetical protein
MLLKTEPNELRDYITNIRNPQAWQMAYSDVTSC